MCNFFSAIGLRDGGILWHPMLDSHSDLLVYHGLDDTADHQNKFVKLELIPYDWMDPETWDFKIDEQTKPVWCTDEWSASARASMVAIAKQFVIRDGTRKLLVDGVWIVGGKADVCDVRAGRIIRVQDSATVRDVRGSATVSDVGPNVMLDESAKLAVKRSKLAVKPAESEKSCESQ